MKKRFAGCRIIPVNENRLQQSGIGSRIRHQIQDIVNDAAKMVVEIRIDDHWGAGYFLIQLGRVFHDLRAVEVRIR